VTRVLVDTNVVIPAPLFPTSTPAQALELALDEHRLVLTAWILAELREVVGRKRPHQLPALEAFLASTSKSPSRGNLGRHQVRLLRSLTRRPLVLDLEQTSS
jgi:predicted nucleic acid-binding protein